jgi:hypothetical protein
MLLVLQKTKIILQLHKNIYAVTVDSSSRALICGTVPVAFPHSTCPSRRLSTVLANRLKSAKSAMHAHRARAAAVAATLPRSAHDDVSVYTPSWSVTHRLPNFPDTSTRSTASVSPPLTENGWRQRVSGIVGEMLPGLRGEVCVEPSFSLNGP